MNHLRACDFIIYNSLASREYTFFSGVPVIFVIYFNEVCSYQDARSSSETRVGPKLCQTSGLSVASAPSFASFPAGRRRRERRTKLLQRHECDTMSQIKAERQPRDPTPSRSVFQETGRPDLFLLCPFPCVPLILPSPLLLHPCTPLLHPLVPLGIFQRHIKVRLALD